MRRDFTFIKSALKKAFALGFVCLASASSAMAGDLVWGDFNATLEAYPTGAGKVYAEVSDTAIVETSDQESALYADMKTPAQSVDVKFMEQVYEADPTTAYFTARAIPADGWLFAGFSQAKETLDEEYETVFEFSDSIIAKTDSSQISLTTYNYNENQATALTSFPLSPSAKYYALFTHVKANPAVGYDSLGTVSISKLCNELGDNVTLTATPSEYRHAKFTHWINKQTGEKETANPLEIKNISTVADYEAYFESDSAMIVSFPKEGGYKLIDLDTHYTVANDTDVVANMVWEDFYTSYETNSLKKCADSTSYCIPASKYMFVYPGTNLIYGKGDVLFVKDGTNAYTLDDNMLGNSGAEGLDLAEQAGFNFYVINLDKQQFELITDTKIAANTHYFKIPTGCFTDLKIDAPKVIYWTDPANNTTGIEDIKADKVSAKTSKGIYTVDGKAVKAPTKGLYIIDGKKVIKLK